MKERLLDMFSFDLRLLGIARILLGLIVIIDLIKRSFNLTTFYTDAGVFPRSVLLENDWFSWNYSIHMMTGTTFGQSLLFLFTGFCALMVLIGYRTKIFLLLTYLLIISLQIRNSQVSHGGDIIMKIILFYFLFLPINARYALDNIAKNTLPKSGKVFSIATIALILQIISIYVFAGIQKNGFAWLEGSAVHYAMHLDMFANQFTLILREFPSLMTILTYSTHYFERFGFLLLFIPFFWKYFRLAGVLAFMGLHFGFYLFLELGIFPWVAMILWIPMFPSMVGDAFEKFIKEKNIYSKLSHFRDKSRFRLNNKLNLFIAEQPYRRLNIPLNLVIGLVAISIFSWNLGTLNSKDLTILKDFKNPEFLKTVTRATALWQSWNMFAPIPMRVDGWFVMDAQIRSGKHIDILNDKDPVSFERPKMLNDYYRNERWQKWLLNMWVNQKKPYLKSWGGYYCKCWNEEHKNTDKELESFSIYFMKEMVPPPGQERAAAQKVSVWSHWCDNKFSHRFE